MQTYNRKEPFLKKKYNRGILAGKPPIFILRQFAVAVRRLIFFVDEEFTELLEEFTESKRKNPIYLCRT